MSDKAGTFQRVSTGGQDEANQLPDLNDWCETREYEITKRYVLHGKSASKGKHQTALDAIIRDMEDGKINVLVVWQTSRLERRGVFSVFDFQRRVLNAGGRIEYVQDAHLNATNELSDVQLALHATMDKTKSLAISKQVKASFNTRRAKGSAIGKPAWGYTIECTVCHTKPEKLRCKDHIKHFVPTAEGRKWIPVIFQWVIDGMSLRCIAQSLDNAAVRTMSGKPWNEQFLSIRLIKNPVYYGERRNNGVLETEALVSPTAWQEANAVVSSRVKLGRGATKYEKALFKPYCGDCWEQPRDGCPSGKSPMYRSYMPYGDAGFYYRCYGQGPQRKGCGSMISVDELDAVVLEAKAANLMPHPERVFVAGDSISDEIARIAERGSEAMLKGDLVLAQECMSKMADLKSQPRVAPHWEERDSGITEADYFASLTRDEQREYLAKSEIVAGPRNEYGDLLLTIVPRVMAAS
jgi:DNA invertase Pin-like site-specific DNA recombinase